MHYITEVQDATKIMTKEKFVTYCLNDWRHIIKAVWEKKYTTSQFQIISINRLEVFSIKLKKLFIISKCQITSHLFFTK